MVPDWDDTLFPPFAANFGLLRDEIEVGAAQPLELGEPHSRGIKQLEDSEVAHVDEGTLPGAHLRHLEEHGDLRPIEVARKMPLQPRRADGARRVGFHQFIAVQKAIEAPHGGERPRH